MKLFDREEREREREADVRGKEKGKRNVQNQSPGRPAAANRKVGSKGHERHAEDRVGPVLQVNALT